MPSEDLSEVYKGCGSFGNPGQLAHRANETSYVASHQLASDAEDVVSVGLNHKAVILRNFDAEYEIVQEVSSGRQVQELLDREHVEFVIIAMEPSRAH